MKSLLSALSLALLVSLTPACDSGPPKADNSKVEKFASKSGILLPPAATVINYRKVVSMDGMELLHLQIPLSDLAEFLTKSGLDGKLNNTTNEKAGISQFGDFLPTHPTKFREGQKSLSSGKYLNVLVGEDSPTTADIYLCWFGV